MVASDQYHFIIECLICGKAVNVDCCGATAWAHDHACVNPPEDKEN